MNSPDSAFGRLASAWEPLPRSATSSALASAVSQGSKDALWIDTVRPKIEAADAPAGTVARVLVAQHLDGSTAAFDCGPLASGQRGRAYRLDRIVVDALDELLDACHARAPRVVLLDVALIREAGVAAFQRLCHRLPATDFVVGWDAPSNDHDMAAILAHARGCIPWSLSAEQLARALDAVTAGEIWFPRAVMASMYLTLLALLPSAASLRLDDAPEVGLTTREAEVLLLIRRGLTNKQIAERLDISPNTVKKHVAHVFAKRGMHGRRQELE